MQRLWQIAKRPLMGFNAACSRYGLTYCGVAFVVWRSHEWLPRDMVFTGGWCGECAALEGT